MRPIFTVPVSLAFAISSAMAQENPTPQNTPPQITPPPTPTVAPVPSSEPEISPEVSLENLIRRAIENSPRLQIASQNLEAAQGRAQSSRAFPGPTLQLVPGLGGNAEARDEEIVLARSLDVFGSRRARAKVGAAEVRRAQAESRLAARGLEVEVKGAAALLFAAQEAENLERVQVEVARLFRDAATRRAALGDVPGVQVQRAELELLRGQNDLANARAQRLTRRTALNTLIGAPPSAPLRVSLPLDASATALLRARIEIPNAPKGDTASSTVTLSNTPTETAAPITSPVTSAQIGGEFVAPDLTARPDLASAQATLEARQAQVQSLRRERLPQIELQARRAPFFGRDGGTTALRAVVTVPLFDFGALRGQRRAAQAEVGAQAATLRLLNQRAVAQAEIARAQLQSRRENVLRYQTHLVPLTLDLLHKTQIGYAQGASTYLEVLEAQRTLRQVQTEYLQALVGVQTGETALDAAINGGFESLDNLSPNSARRGDAR